MPIIRVQADPIDIGAAYGELLAGRTDIGGLGAFVGTVRDSAKGHPITAMTLEHYPGMTERAMAAIGAEAEARWNLMGSLLVHRVGPMRPGETIVLVLAASAHRQAALDASAFLIDWLKTRAPFWKKESFADGREAWVDARESDDAAAARWGAV